MGSIMHEIVMKGRIDEGLDEKETRKVEART